VGGYGEAQHRLIALSMSDHMPLPLVTISAVPAGVSWFCTFSFGTNIWYLINSYNSQGKYLRRAIVSARNVQSTSVLNN
jgi:hypothetical protein